MSDTQQPEKKKRNRSPSEPKPVFIFVQLMDDNGEPVATDTSRVKLLAVARDADTAISYMDTSKYPHAVCLRTMLAPTRSAQAPQLKVAAE